MSQTVQVCWSSTGDGDGDKPHLRRNPEETMNSESVSRCLRGTVLVFRKISTFSTVASLFNYHTGTEEQTTAVVLQTVLILLTLLEVIKVCFH